jgi:hypothetical protein
MQQEQISIWRMNEDDSFSLVRHCKTGAADLWLSAYEAEEEETFFCKSYDKPRIVALFNGAALEIRTRT